MSIVVYWPKRQSKKHEKNDSPRGADRTFEL